MAEGSIPRRQHVYKRPTEVVDGARPSSLKRVALTVVIAGLVMLVFGSKALLNWTNNLPIGPISDFLLFLAQGWQDAMDKIGVTWLAEALRAALNWFQGLR